MRITKEEAYFLAEALKTQKYEYISHISDKETSDQVFKAFQQLEKRLFDYEKDKRRNGRTTENSHWDKIKRFPECQERFKKNK